MPLSAVNMSVYSDFIEYLDQNNGITLDYQKDAPLSEHSTFRIGGRCDLIVFPYSGEVLAALLRRLSECKVRYTVIGNGSNVLFDDGGYRGVVLCTTRMNGIKVCGDTLECDSGASFSYLALVALKNSLSGLEFAYGIPGTVGGAVYMNAGAYDGETSAVLLTSTYYDPKDGSIVTISGAEHEFAYRKSVYTDSDLVILGAKFGLVKGNPDQIKAKMDDFMFRRRSKQPLEYPSAGSAFKRYPGFFTAQLIDEAGLKGFSVGGAQVSEKHAGFIINKGSATCSDVLELIEIIKGKIYENYGIHIETEVRYIV